MTEQRFFVCEQPIVTAIQHMRIGERGNGAE
jgi:hypothetical protein